MNNNLSAVLLGTGTPNADPDRSGPSVALIAGGSPYLVDAGPGIVRRAAAAHAKGIGELEVSKLDTVFLTHLHSDHTVGLPDLLLTPWVLERTSPLRIFGPSGAREMAENIQQAFRNDIDERSGGLQPSNDTGYAVEVTEISAGDVYQDENVLVKALQVSHGSLESYSYKFITPGRMITLSGDTTPLDGLAEFYAGSNVLIHEVYSDEGFRRYPPEWQKYHSAVHTSSSELAKIASQVNPGLLVLYHQLFNGVTEADLLAEVSSLYRGKVVSGCDLDVF